MFLFLFVLAMFVAFPTRNDGIFGQIYNKESEINIFSSGSLGVYIDGKCKITSPNMTLVEDRKLDWCSNIPALKGDKPWITYSLKNKAMRIKGYSVRTGCCYYGCCCIDDSHFTGSACCCDLYSYSLQGSNDNSTWTILHKMEKVDYVDYCKLDTFDFQLTESYRYIKFVLDEPRPGCENCIALNQLELYGETIDADHSDSYIDNDDESISIIGKVRRDE